MVNKIFIALFANDAPTWTDGATNFDYSIEDLKQLYHFTSQLFSFKHLMKYKILHGTSEDIMIGMNCPLYVTKHKLNL